MKLLEAIKAVTEGNIVSSAGDRRYTLQQLQPKWIGPSAVKYNDVGMTREEVKGTWWIEKTEY